MASDGGLNKRSLLEGVETVLRVGFFALAPFGVVRAATLFPLGGALADVAIVLLLIPFADSIRHLASRKKLWALIARKTLAFEAYYREHAPRPFLYYVLYPILFPYWLVVPAARREFLLFKGYNLAGVGVLLGVALFRYGWHWAPTLPWRAFVPTLLVMLAYEAAIVLALLMPIATTVIDLHMQRRRRLLLCLMGVGVVATVAAAVPLLRRHDPIVSYETRTRLRLRTEQNGPKARTAMATALRAAWKEADELPASTEGDGKIEGVPLEAARQALRGFYESDEAAAFDLWGAPRRRPKLLVIYTEGVRGRDPFWLGLTEDGRTMNQPDKLPKGAFRAMQHAMR